MLGRQKAKEPIEMKEEKQTQQVAVRSKAAPPAALTQQIKANAGKGLSKAQEDNLVPLIYILQTNSPQVNKRDPSYINGAEAGDIWLRNAPDPIVRGDDGILFQPCFFAKSWNEWIPRSSGGGFVARHAELPKEAELKEDPENPNRKKYLLPNGNEVIETREHVGLVHIDDQVIPFVIPLTSTGHSFSRKWMFMMNAKKVEGCDVPTFACVYRLKSVFKQNAAGSWYMFDVEDGDWVSEEDFQAGLTIHEAFASGAKQAEAPVVHDAVQEETNI